ncbi:MAG: GFA family protein [bacterium]
MPNHFDVPFSGGCACGAIRYECSVAPRRMVNCHCRDCQRASGSAYSATVIMAASAVRVLRGQCAAHRTEVEGGNVAKREFCSACGSPLFASTSARPDVVGVKASSLDDPSWFAPQADVWAGSAQPWDHMDPRLPKFAKNRPRPGDA